MVDHSDTHDAHRRTSDCPSGAAEDRSLARLGAVGIALVHFTEPLRAYTRRHLADDHVATTILTKQLELALATHDPAGRLGELLLEPDRFAVPDGTTAKDLLGDAWADFESDVAVRVAATIAFIRAEGLRSFLRLSAWYGMSDPTPWWGTPAWDEYTARLADRSSTPSTLMVVLRTRPEIVDHLTLCRVLSSGHGHRSADQLRPSTAA